MGSPSIFKGNAVKHLKDELEFQSGVRTITNSPIDPTSTSVDAPAGSTLHDQSGNIYVKQDAGDTTNWTLLGSGGGGGGATPGNGNPIATFKDVKVAGTNGGAGATGSFITRDLNTAGGDTSFSSIGSNQITLDPGTYFCHFIVPLFGTGLSQSRLYDTTGTAVLIEGASVTSADDQVSSVISGQFTLTASSTIEVQVRITSTNGLVSLGQPSNFSTNEVYTQGYIEQIAAGGGGGGAELGAVMESNPASIVSQTGTWIDSITRDSFGEYTIDYTSAGFTNIPFIMFTREFRGCFHIIRTISNTSCSFTCYTSSTGNRDENADKIHVMAIPQD